MSGTGYAAMILCIAALVASTPSLAMTQPSSGDEPWFVVEAVAPRWGGWVALNVYSPLIVSSPYNCSRAAVNASARAYPFGDGGVVLDASLSETAYCTAPSGASPFYAEARITQLSDGGSRAEVSVRNGEVDARYRIESGPREPGKPAEYSIHAEIRGAVSVPDEDEAEDYVANALAFVVIGQFPWHNRSIRISSVHYEEGTAYIEATAEDSAQMPYIIRGSVSLREEHRETPYGDTVVSVNINLRIHAPRGYLRLLERLAAEWAKASAEWRKAVESSETDPFTAWVMIVEPAEAELYQAAVFWHFELIDSFPSDPMLWMLVYGLAASNHIVDVHGGGRGDLGGCTAAFSPVQGVYPGRCPRIQYTFNVSVSDNPEAKASLIGAALYSLLGYMYPQSREAWGRGEEPMAPEWRLTRYGWTSSMYVASVKVPVWNSRVAEVCRSIAEGIGGVVVNGGSCTISIGGDPYAVASALRDIVHGVGPSATHTATPTPASEQPSTTTASARGGGRGKGAGYAAPAAAAAALSTAAVLILVLARRKARAIG